MIRFLLTTLISILMLPVAAQDFSTAPPQAVITGVVTNAITGDTLSLPSISYKGHGIAVSGNTQGYFRIPHDRLPRWWCGKNVVGIPAKTTRP